jgi:hypothetical protein
MDRVRSIVRVTRIEEEVRVAGGSTKAIEVTTGLSGSWQQDIEQFIRANPWPQSSDAEEFAGAFW